MRAKLSRPGRSQPKPGPIAPPTPIRWRRAGSSVVVSVSGEMTSVYGARLNETLCQAPWRTTLDLLVDLSDLGAMNSAAANDLLDAYVTMTLRRGTLRVTGLNASVRAALEAVSGPRLVSAIELPGAPARTAQHAFHATRVWHTRGHTPQRRPAIRRRTQ